MTYLTEPRIKAKICDIDFDALLKIGNYLDDNKIEYYWSLDRISSDGVSLYKLEADVTGFSSELYVFLDNLNR